MKLCYLADPTSIHTVKWLKYFLQRGDEIHLLGWNRPTDPALADVHYHHLPLELHPPNIRLVSALMYRFGLGPLLEARAYRQLLDKIQPDLFDVQSIWLGTFGAALCGFRPLVITPWGGDLILFPKDYSAIQRLLLRLALRRGEWVLGDSAELEAAAVRYGARPDRLRRVVSGIDLRVFTPGVDGSQVHARFGVSAGPVLFCPRTLRPIYDQESIIRAMPEIRRAHPAAHLILAGSRDDDPSYVAVLDELLTDLDLVDSVHFAGRIPNSEMPAFYGAADLVVSVPKSDSRPSSLFEAMACGVPVVVSDVPAILEIVQREQNGLVIPVGDFEALAEGVCRLLADKALREQFVHHNLVLVQKQGNYEAEMARVAALYDELIARYRSQRGTSKPR